MADEITVRSYTVRSFGVVVTVNVVVVLVALAFVSIDEFVAVSMLFLLSEVVFRRRCLTNVRLEKTKMGCCTFRKLEEHRT